MEKKDLNSLGSIIVILAAGAGIGYAGSSGGTKVFGNFPLFAFNIMIAFIIQWVMFIHAYVNETEKYYDLTGSITYITITILSVTLSPNIDTRSLILMSLVLIWAFRLGSYLFRRILRSGKD